MKKFLTINNLWAMIFFILTFCITIFSRQFCHTKIFHIYPVELFIVFSLLCLFYKKITSKNFSHIFPYKKTFLFFILLFLISLVKGFFSFDDKNFIIRESAIFYYAIFGLFIYNFFDIGKLKIFKIVVVVGAFTHTLLVDNFLIPYHLNYGYFYMAMSSLILFIKILKDPSAENKFTNYVLYTLFFLTIYFQFFYYNCRASWLGTIFALAYVFIISIKLKILKNLNFKITIVGIILLISLTSIFSRQNINFFYQKAKTIINFTKNTPIQDANTKLSEEKLISISLDEIFNFIKDLKKDNKNVAISDAELQIFITDLKNAGETTFLFRSQKILRFYENLQSFKAITLKEITDFLIKEKENLDKNEKDNYVIENLKINKNDSMVKILSEMYVEDQVNVSQLNSKWRLDAWKGFIREGLKTPVLGNGFGKKFRPQELFKAYYSENGEDRNWTDPHNTYVAIFFRTGFVGLLMFLFLVFIILKDSIKIMLQTKKDDENFYNFLLFSASSIYFLVLMSFMPALNAPYLGIFFWIFLGILIYLQKNSSNFIQIYEDKSST